MVVAGPPYHLLTRVTFFSTKKITARRRHHHCRRCRRRQYRRIIIIHLVHGGCVRCEGARRRRSCCLLCRCCSFCCFDLTVDRARISDETVLGSHGKAKLQIKSLEVMRTRGIVYWCGHCSSIVLLPRFHPKWDPIQYSGHPISSSNASATSKARLRYLFISLSGVSRSFDARG